MNFDVLQTVIGDSLDWSVVLGFGCVSVVFWLCFVQQLVLKVIFKPTFV
jgi:hypothetical protein